MTPSIPPTKCPYNGIPRLQYEPGCWFIRCDRLKCHCAMSDGDNTEADEIIQKWGEAHLGRTELAHPISRITMFAEYFRQSDDGGVIKRRIDLQPKDVGWHQIREGVSVGELAQPGDTQPHENGVSVLMEVRSIITNSTVGLKPGDQRYNQWANLVYYPHIT